jgi:hypothetical protein
MLGASAPRERECTVETARDELVAGEPDRVVDDAAKAEVLALLHDEPGPPAGDRLDVIGCCAHGAQTLAGSIGSSAGEGLGGDSVGSAGGSRGTGSSSGSTVKVRSGSPISTSSSDPTVGLIKVLRSSRHAASRRRLWWVRRLTRAATHASRARRSPRRARSVHLQRRRPRRSLADLVRTPCNREGSACRFMPQLRKAHPP